MPDGLRCYWQVTAGLIPGTIDGEYSRMWSMTSREFQEDVRGEVFLEKEARASGYARYLQLQAINGGPVNWASLDFFWL